MAIQSRDHLKSKYVTGSKPQSSDYADWLDSFPHKTELGSTVAIPAGGGTGMLSAGELIDRIIVTSATAQAVSIGTTPGGTEVVEAQPIAANGFFVHAEDFYAHQAPLTLYFSCTAAITVRIRKTVFA